MKFLQPPYRLSFFYLAIFFILSLIHITVFIFSPNTDTGAGHFAFFITLPWSLLTTLIADAMGYIAWSDSFTHNNPAPYGFLSMLSLLPAALINATLLFAASRKGNTGSVKTS